MKIFIHFFVFLFILLEQDTNNGFQVVLEQSTSYASPYGGDITTVNVDFIYETNEVLHIRYTKKIFLLFS